MQLPSKCSTQLVYINELTLQIFLTSTFSRKYKKQLMSKNNIYIFIYYYCINTIEQVTITYNRNQRLIFDRNISLLYESNEKFVYGNLHTCLSANPKYGSQCLQRHLENAGNLNCHSKKQFKFQFNFIFSLGLKKLYVIMKRTCVDLINIYHEYAIFI